MIKTIKKILKNQQLTIQEVNEFIEKYVEKQLGKIPTSQEILGINNMLMNGLFNLQYAAKEFALKLGLSIVSVQDINTGQILRIDVYE